MLRELRVLLAPERRRVRAAGVPPIHADDRSRERIERLPWACANDRLGRTPVVLACRTTAAARKSGIAAAHDRQSSRVRGHFAQGRGWPGGGVPGGGGAAPGLGAAVAPGT